LNGNADEQTSSSEGGGRRTAEGGGLIARGNEELGEIAGRTDSHGEDDEDEDEDEDDDVPDWGDVGRKNRGKAVGERAHSKGMGMRRRRSPVLTTR
jgi:hypothetical protein